MGELKVTSEELDQIGGNLATGAQSIDEQLGQLRGQVAPLAGGDWVGAASGRFNELWNEWDSGAKQVHESLTGLSQLLRQAASSYAQTEEEIARSMGSS